MLSSEILAYESKINQLNFTRIQTSLPYIEIEHKAQKQSGKAVYNIIQNILATQ